jgi:predicted nucleic acid-binding protein
VFIHRIQLTPAYKDILKSITDHAEAGRLTIVTSVLSLVEVVKCDTTLTDEKQERLVTEFFRNPYLEVRHVDQRVANEARRIVRGYQVRPADAIHIASAIIMGADEFNTYDDRVLKKSGKIDGMSCPILSPSWVNGQAPLFEMES